MACIGFFMLGCSDDLELSDPNNIGSEIALSTDKNIKTTLIGAYDALSAPAFFGGNTQRNSELLAANAEITFTGTFNDPADIYRKSMITANADATAMWLSAYSTINICNNVLSALERVNAEDRAQVEGEALFLRGLSLFELTLFFAKPYSAGSVTTNLGVPIMSVEDRNSTGNKARATVAETYAAIVSDLTRAESLLGADRKNGKATKASAAAVLSRVYLQTANYTGARDAADRVISSGNYSLTSSVAAAFNGTHSVEDVFDIPVSSVDGLNTFVTFYSATVNGGRGDIEIQAPHFLQYEPGDARRSFYYTDPATGDTRTSKWVNRFSSVKVIRLAELYLTRAECNIRLNTSVGAAPLADLNRIRSRANLSPLAVATIAAALQERRIELAHEGARIHDIKRLGLTIVEGTNSYPFNSNRLVFPIPQREIDINKGLIQNEGY